jgi:hypothetical protein
MRTSVRITLALGLALAAAFAGAVVLQAQKARSIELSALFREDPGDKIHSDGAGLYYTVRDPDRVYASVVQLDTDGRLHMVVRRHRKVILEFDTQVRPAPRNSRGQLTCHDYNGDVVFYIDPPSFLTGVPDYSSVYFTTFGKITYDGTGWVYDPSTMFDFRTMAVDANAATLVRAQINFYVDADPVGSGYGVMPNYRLWSADVPLTGGLLRVTHPTADSWVVEPQVADDPAAPLRGLGPDEAGFKFTTPEVRRVHPGGNCDLGDWVMPFQITLYLR